MPEVRRLLTIGHSYVVAANRRLAHEMAVHGRGRWQVTAVAPSAYRGDLGRIALQPLADEANTLTTVPVRLDAFPHFMRYAGLNGLLDAPWSLVHCWEEPYIAAGAQIARSIRRDARFVVASFQNIAKSYPWPLNAFERTTMARADAWIAFGQTVHDTLATRAGYAGKRSSRIPPGVDVERFKPDRAAGDRTLAKIGWDRAIPVVGYLGRFVPQKGLAVLRDALHGVSGPWRALFVGGGPMKTAIETFARQYPGRVHIATGVAHDDVPAWLNAMTVLCAPSQTTARWREQFGRMLIEAMACGVPVIASDSGEMPFVIAGAGTIVAEGDAAVWSAAIDRVLADPALREEHVRRGLERAHGNFAWPVVARAHLAFFDSLLERGAL